jgi:tRNA U34 5-methylaminomethyl-2-thiouridine-forming methyltransferase MnmC
LNALLSIKELLDTSFSVTYVGIEKFPISEELWKTLNYPDIIGLKDCFEVLHNAEWDKKNRINESFLFEKRTTDILDFHSESKFDLIYFDAFSPTSQPELWTIEVFKSMYDALNKNGILVTYCAKGQVRRDLQTAGFHMERLPGPPGKREMLRGTKL